MILSAVPQTIDHLSLEKTPALRRHSRRIAYPRSDVMSSTISRQRFPHVWPVPWILVLASFLRELRLLFARQERRLSITVPVVVLVGVLLLRVVIVFSAQA
jgi:hypothetical protein